MEQGKVGALFSADWSPRPAGNGWASGPGLAPRAVSLKGWQRITHGIHLGSTLIHPMFASFASGAHSISHWGVLPPGSRHSSRYALCQGALFGKMSRLSTFKTTFGRANSLQGSPHSQIHTLRKALRDPMGEGIYVTAKSHEIIKSLVFSLASKNSLTGRIGILIGQLFYKLAIIFLRAQDLFSSF